LIGIPSLSAKGEIVWKARRSGLEYIALIEY
jgi:hypothetical protein